MRIDFIPPLRPGRFAWWGAVPVGGALLVVVGLYVSNLGKSLANRHELERLRLELSTQAKRPQVQVGESVPYAEDAWVAWTRSRFATGQTLNAIEKVALHGVVVEQIELSEAEHTVLIELVASDYGVLVQYVELLNKASPLSKWRLVKASVTGSQNSAVHAQILCET